MALGDAEDIRSFSLTEPNPSRAIVIANPGGTEVVDGTWERVIQHVALDLNERGATSVSIGVGSTEKGVREKAKRLRSKLRDPENHGIPATNPLHSLRLESFSVVTDVDGLTTRLQVSLFFIIFAPKTPEISKLCQKSQIFVHNSVF